MNKVNAIIKLLCHLKWGNTDFLFFQTHFNKTKTYRYRGKKSPSAIIAEICWWSKLVWQDKDDLDDKEFSEDAEGPTVESHIDIMCGSETDDSDECDATSL